MLDFTLENRTGHTLQEVYLSPAKKDNWGKQILRAPLKDGADLKASAGSRSSGTRPRARRWR